MKTAFPKNGPTSQPAAAKPIVLSPSTIIGSKLSVCAPIESRSRCISTIAPTAVQPPAEMIDDTSEIRRRVLRSARKRFQVSGWLDEEGEEGLLVGAAAAAAAEEVVVEARRAEARLGMWTLGLRRTVGRGALRGGVRGVFAGREAVE